MFTPQGFGSFENPFQLYFSALENTAQSFGPMKGVARAQIEMMGLMSRRAQAYLEIPSRLSRCRSPQDLMNEQMRFWQTAFQQYSESSHKVMEAWGQAFASMPSATTFASQPRRQRDYISFPDVRSANGKSPPGAARERHVA